MQIIRSMIVAFSMYSKIPMPQFAWRDEDMKYMLCFFPWVGAVIGALLYLWRSICVWAGVGTLCDTLVGAAIPLLITGGFHVDGFMDTMDAFHSYQPRERKLEILKDSHIGAFAVIHLAAYGLIYLAAYSEIRDLRMFKTVCAGFFLSRCLSGIAVVTFPNAKKEGMLHGFADRAEKRKVRACLFVQTVLCVGFLLSCSVWGGAVVALTALAVFRYYEVRTKRELGGITGDTAGYFVVLCEGGIVVAAAIAEVCFRIFA